MKKKLNYVEFAFILIFIDSFWPFLLAFCFLDLVILEPQYKHIIFQLVTKLFTVSYYV